MNRTISLFLALVMTFALAGIASAEGETPTFVISEETAAPGETVRVTISIQNNTAISSVQLVPQYDHDVLEWTAVEQGDYVGTWNPRIDRGFVNWFGESGHNVSYDGVFATLVFTVKSDAAAGDYEVTVTYDPDDVFDQDEENVHFDVQAGKVTVTGDTSAAFTGHKLLLSSEIGVQFRVTVPAKTDTNGWYMRFDFSDGRSSATQPIGDAEKEGSTTYWFTAFVNPLELADTITATLYCNGNTVVNSYSAMTYFDSARSTLSGSANVINVVNALQDYGHYLLASGWSDGKKHAAIKAATGSLNIETAKAGVSGMAAVKELNNTGVSDATVELTLDSRTQINVIVKLDKGVTMASEKGFYTALPDGRFRLSSAKIGPKNLLDVWTVSIKTSKGTAKVNASAMSYVYAVLNDGGFSKAQQQAMAAFYFYCLAAKAY